MTVNDGRTSRYGKEHFSMLFKLCIFSDNLFFALNNEYYKYLALNKVISVLLNGKKLIY